MTMTGYKETKQGMYWPTEGEGGGYALFNKAPTVRREITVTFGRREELMLGVRFIYSALRHRRRAFYVSHEDSLT